MGPAEGSWLGTSTEGATEGTEAGANQDIRLPKACCRNTSLLVESTGHASKGREKIVTSSPRQATLEAVKEKNKEPNVNKIGMVGKACTQRTQK